MSIETGGPAFPVSVLPGSQTGPSDGMTLRDWFAGQALSLGEGVWCGDNLLLMATHCYSIADAMLEARKEKK
jgi:hypothetical protein